MGSGTDSRIARVLEVMHHQFAYPWRIPQLAALAGLSTSRFAHVFEAQIGMAPLRYLQQLRLDRARRLLEGTTASVATIMRSVGYADASHFSKEFRRRFGAGPREYRRDHRAARGCRPPASDPRSSGRGDPPAREKGAWKNHRD